MWRRGRAQDDFSEEIRAHLEMETDRLRGEGLSEADANAQARREFGNVTRVEEQYYESNRILLALEIAWHDVRYGVRVLCKSPAFTLVAVLSLALGIGANVALFQLVNAVMLRSLPVRNPQELVRITWKGPDVYTGGNRWAVPWEFTNPEWERLREKHDVFSSMFAWSGTDFNLTPAGEIRKAQGLYASGDLFQTLGVPAEIGRVLTGADDQRGCGAGEAVISHSFWQREYGGSRSVLGRKMTIENHSVAIIGVTPAWFTGVEVGIQFDVAVPLCAQATLGDRNALDDRHSFWLGAFARMKPGVTVQQASAYIAAVTPGMLESTIHPGWLPEFVKDYLKNKLEAVAGGSGYSGLRQDVKSPLLMLLAIAGLVLLIACANLANLMLARATTRQAEIAIRLSLGASRGRVIRQLLAESMLLAISGCALGALFAQGLSRYLIVSFGTSTDSPYLDLSLDWRTFGFMVALAVLSCLLFGLAPALRATRNSPSASMKVDARGLTTTRERFGLQRALVVSQIALALILLLTSLLFIRSFTKLMTLDPGFRKEGVLTVGVGLNDPVLKHEPLLAFEQLLDRLRHTPGVDHAATVLNMPLSGNSWGDNIRIDGVSPRTKRETNVNFNRVSDGYFETMGVPLYAGRDFDAHDRLGALEVAVVDQTFAERFFHGRSPLGRTFHLEVGPGETPHQFQIVGVVKRTKYTNLQREFRPLVYLAMGQDWQPYEGIWFAVHSRLPLGTTIAAARHSLMSMNPNLSLIFRSLPAMAQDSVRRESLIAKLSSFFGLLAIVLATIGLYGVNSYIVTQRRHEIGIRLALGAERRVILRKMLSQSVMVLLIGLVVGSIIALAAGKVAQSLLFELKPNDPWTFCLAIAGVSLVSFLASLLPALKAANIPPMAALREE